MIWLVVAVFLCVLAVLTFLSRPQVPWIKQLRQSQSEWMAPELVASRVKSNYLDAMEWLRASQTMPWDVQWLGAPQYFSGLFLKRHQEILKRYRIGKIPPYLGIMECDHVVTVRAFSEDGERCLIVDEQTHRRMLTYRVKTAHSYLVQALDSCTLVHEMVYDYQLRRWKIERYVQQLPLNWRQIRLSPILPPSTGRDS